MEHRLTLLQEHLGGAAATRLQPEDVFVAAKELFASCQRVDMQSLAGKLGIGRTTLYRWAGSRDQLLVEVVWFLGEKTLLRHQAQTPPEAPNRAATMISAFVRDTLTYPGMRHFLDNEGEYAMRLLTLAEHGFHTRLVNQITDILEIEMQTGRCSATAPAGEMSYAAVRLIESFVHNRVLTRRDPDPDAANRVLIALLR